MLQQINQDESVRRDYHSTIDQVPTAAAIGTPPPVRRISNDNGSSANNISSGSGRGADNDHQQQQLSWVLLHFLLQFYRADDLFTYK